MSTPQRIAHEAAVQLADGLATHLERWVRELGGDALTAQRLREATRALSLATGDGHVCLALGDLAEAAPGTSVADWRRTLLGSGVVGTPEAPGAMPLVLDTGDRLYLHRHFAYERRLADRVMRAAAAPDTPVDDATRALLNDLFRANQTPDATPGTAHADWQKVAAALALRRRLTVISGGPGTGKTTTVVNLLACLLAQDPACRIALAAPTGKAAARLTDAIRQRAAHLPPALRALLPAESFTVHRLLGVTPAAGGFVHHAANPLPIDALVVDEASMLDLALAAKLLDAVPETARIVLLGDKDQLAAVEAGAVFSELCADPTLTDARRADLAALCETPAARLAAPAPVRASALRDSVVWFTRNFRFTAESGIGRLASHINAGDAPAALDALRRPADGSLQWLEAPGAAGRAGAALDPRTRAALFAGYAPYLHAVAQHADDPAAVAAAFAGFRALCAVRAGAHGVVALNALLSEHLADALPRGTRSPWFAGRPVIVLRNDPLLRLFNGDVGIALPTAGADGALAVHFEDSTAAGGFRTVAPLRLPPHETAFAMTVHKSQGSEFDDVMVLLPAQRSPVVTRELLYTAVTRARRHVTLVGTEPVLGAAIEAPTRRRSGLIARLGEAR